MGYYRETEDLNGLSGWLILVGIGVVLTPFKILAGVGEYLKIFQDGGTWDAIATRDTPHYNPLLAGVIGGECIFNVIFFIASIYLIYLFFSKNYLFPRIYIILAATRLAIFVFDSWAVSKLIPNHAMFGEESDKELLSLCAAVIIWSPYMLISQRVCQTFVRGKKNEDELNPESEETTSNWV